MVTVDVFYKDLPDTQDFRIETICYLRRKNFTDDYEYLLGKHHKQGKWNGFGGKVGDKEEFKNETIEEAVKREGVEEFGVSAKDLIKRAEIKFFFYDKEGKENKVFCHIYFCDNWEGEITSSAELQSPTWFTSENMPWDEMWPNDKMWLEKLVSREGFLKAKFYFEPNGKAIDSQAKMEWE